MRAGPLSNQKIIDLLNSSFVPVYTVNEDYSRKGSAPEEEKKLRDSIFKQGHELKLSVGTVHVYLLDPQGRLVDSMHVAEAARPARLLEKLEQTVDRLKVAAGPPVVPPKPQAARPACEKEGLALHLVARSLDGKGAWSEFPVENWIVLTPPEAKRLLPPGKKAKVGDRWPLDPEVSERILTWFYPATENNDPSKNQFTEKELLGEVVSVSNKKVEVRLHGKIKMAHWFYHKADDKSVEASIVGFMDLDPARQQISTFRLVTEKATYGGGQFAVAVQNK